MTDDLDPNELGRLLRELKEYVSPPRHGRVVNVWTHTTESDQSNHEVDVAVPPGGEVDQQHRRIPVMQFTPGAACVPSEDSLVLVLYRNGDEPVAIGGVYGDADDDRAPLAGEDDVRLRRKDATIEIVTTDAGDDVVRVTRQPTDGEAPDMGLELNLSSGEFQISDASGWGIRATNDGDLHLHGSVKQHTSTTIDF